MIIHKVHQSRDAQTLTHQCRCLGAGGGEVEPKMPSTLEGLTPRNARKRPSGDPSKMNLSTEKLREGYRSSKSSGAPRPGLLVLLLVVVVSKAGTYNAEGDSRILREAVEGANKQDKVTAMAIAREVQGQRTGIVIPCGRNYYTMIIPQHRTMTYICMWARWCQATLPRHYRCLNLPLQLLFQA